MKRPRSIVRLVVYGLCAVTLPLLAAVVIATYQANKVARLGQAGILQAEEATAASRVLVEELHAMERSVGQYLVLGDTEYSDSYRQQRRSFLKALKQLSKSPNPSDLSEDVQHLGEMEAELSQRIFATPESPIEASEISTLSQRWEPMAILARDILDRSRNQIVKNASTTRDAAGNLKKSMAILLVTTLSLAAILSITVVLSVARPMGRLNRAIRQLGDGNLGADIEIAGPKDVVELAEQLNHMRQRINELEQQKTEFLQHVSHELKTPLSAIAEGADLLNAPIADEMERREIAGIIGEATQQLKHLVEKLLDFGRLQASDRLNPIFAKVEYARLIQSTVTRYDMIVRSRGIAVETRLEPIRIEANEAQLRQLLDNLISNAVKFAPASNGRIVLDLVRQDGLAVLNVRDNGPGLSRQERLRVFNPFEQGLADAAGSVRGTGLGLTIARQYARSHGGDINFLESIEGAHAQVKIPLRQRKH